MPNSRSIEKTETMDFYVMMDSLVSKMWDDKDKSISDYKRKGGKKPYRHDDNYYTTANDLKWRWEMDWHLCHETKYINAPKGSKMEKCREWLRGQVSSGKMEMMLPKAHCISSARFKRKGKPWGVNTEELMEVKPEIVHIDDGHKKAYCQARKKKPERKNTWRRPRPGKFIRTTKNKDKVTCKQCGNLMKSSNPDIQKEIIVLTLQNDS